MICPVCNRVMPDKAVICPVCAQAKSDAAIRDAQAEYFLRVRSGQWQFITCKDVAKGTTHVRMFGADKSFCGEKLMIEKRNLGRQAWDGELAKICAGCRIEVKRIMEGLPQ